MTWVEEIVAAFEALDGAARYKDLYEFIERTTNRSLTPEWKASVRRTIEDHSSDSANHRAADLFQHLDTGFWCLRGRTHEPEIIHQRRNQEPKQIVDEALRKQESTKQGTKRVFVHEHWRAWPGEGETKPPSVTLDTSMFVVVAAWVTDTHLALKFANGLLLQAPLEWFPAIKKASPIQRSKLEVHTGGVGWSDLGEQVLLEDIFIGRRS